MEARLRLAIRLWHRFANTNVESFDEETHKAEYLVGSAFAKRDRRTPALSTSSPSNMPGLLTKAYPTIPHYGIPASLQPRFSRGNPCLYHPKSLPQSKKSAK